MPPAGLRLAGHPDSSRRPPAALPPLSPLPEGDPLRFRGEFSGLLPRRRTLRASAHLAQVPALINTQSLLTSAAVYGGSLTSLSLSSGFKEKETLVPCLAPSLAPLLFFQRFYF